MESTYTVTIFKNIKDISTPYFRSDTEVLDRIKDGKSKALIKKIRTEKDKTKRNDLKKNLPAICFSGQFWKRSDSEVVAHSGIICLDFDGYPSKKTMLEDKEMFTKDKYVYSVFISPSGNGLKVLVKIPPVIDDHKQYFNSLDKYFGSQFFDQTCSNISRVCYESFDPTIFINKNSSIWEKKEDVTYQEYNKYEDVPTIPLTDYNEVAERLVKWWEKEYPMVEGQRNNNGFVLAMAFLPS